MLYVCVCDSSWGPGSLSHPGWRFRCQVPHGLNVCVFTTTWISVSNITRYINIHWSPWKTACTWIGQLRKGQIMFKKNINHSWQKPGVILLIPDILHCAELGNLSNDFLENSTAFGTYVLPKKCVCWGSFGGVLPTSSTREMEFHSVKNIPLSAFL